MTLGTKTRGGVVLAGLLGLALLAGNASPGFPLTGLPAAVGRTLARALGPAHAAPGTTPQVPGAPDLRASTLALSDIPLRYLELYATAAHTCPPLTWQLLAGIGKVESDHGRSAAPGVHSSVNSFGCCAGPMQFNVTNGHPSTWEAYGEGGNVYDPADAIPATARMLCGNGLTTTTLTDPCPTLPGSPQAHQAVHHYNHACWYVHEVLTWATRYTTTPPPTRPAAPDPFQAALATNPHLATTTSRGCNPTPDLIDPHLDLRVQSILTVLAGRDTIRISCLHSGHSYYVAGTHRISNHTVWRAVDIDQVNGQPVSPSNPQAHALAQWLDQLQGPLRPTEVGSPWDFGHRPYFTNAAHQNHIHIGYGQDPCVPQATNPRAPTPDCE